MNVELSFVRLAGKKFPKLHSDCISSSQSERGSRPKGVTDRQTFKPGASCTRTQPKSHLKGSLWQIPRLFPSPINYC